MLRGMDSLSALVESLQTFIYFCIFVTNTGEKMSGTGEHRGGGEDPDRVGGE